MRIDHPLPRHMQQQRQLWQEAFGDTDTFLDSFFRTAYAPDRCRCILDGDTIAAILYWMDCSLENRKLAYLYAVVTKPEYRGQGLCRKLMADTHALLQNRGYAGAVLVPQKESLRAMYGKLGYEDMGGLREFSCAAAGTGTALRAIGPEEFSALRRQYLPEGGLLQEGESLAFLAEQLQFYAGTDFLLAAYEEKGILHGVELLGNQAAAPGILKALGCSRGSFRTSGTEIPFAMYCSLSADKIKPLYLGFAFD